MTEKIEGAAQKPAPPLSEWIVTVALLFVMGAAYGVAQSWPARSALFPELLTGLALLLLVLKLGQLVYQAVAARRAAMPVIPLSQMQSTHEADPGVVIKGDDEDEADEEELHEIFSSAGSRGWAAVIGWVALLFGGVYLLGLFIILPVFTILYLRVVAKAPIVAAIVYAVFAGGGIYLLFVEFLHLPVPEGVLFG